MRGQVSHLVSCVGAPHQRQSAHRAPSITSGPGMVLKKLVVAVISANAYRRTAKEHGSTGGRALILAPQSLDYVVSLCLAGLGNRGSLSIPQRWVPFPCSRYRTGDRSPRRPRSSTMSSNTSAAARPKRTGGDRSRSAGSRCSASSGSSFCRSRPSGRSCTCSTPRFHARKPVSWPRIESFRQFRTKL